MKKFLLALFALGFGSLLVLISAVHAGKSGLVSQAGAQETGVGLEGEASEGAKMLAPTPFMLPMQTENEGVDYYLPYPGMLPDNPLYVLKVVRDKFKVWISGDEQKKVEELLLCADKRIGAALVLVEGGKVELGVETALKAEQYLKQSNDLLEGLGAENLEKKMAKAVEKHREVLDGLKESLGGDSLVVWEEANGLNGLVREKYGNDESESEEEAMDEKVDEVDENIENDEEYYPVEIGL